MPVPRRGAFYCVRKSFAKRLVTVADQSLSPHKPFSNIRKLWQNDMVGCC